MRFIIGLLRFFNLMQPEAQSDMEKPKLCNYCKKNPATRQYKHVQIEETTGVGNQIDTSMTVSGLSYSCDDMKCVWKARLQEAIRTEEITYSEPVLIA